jgi:hypothetical protein
MTQQHPITPPSELLQLWFEQHDDYNKGINELLIEAAQYGADQELEACCELTRDNDGYDAALALRAARRPKSSSLKEQALEALQALQQRTTDPGIIEPLRRALEQLPD